jgi:dipeptidase E
MTIDINRRQVIGYLATASAAAAAGTIPAAANSDGSVRVKTRTRQIFGIGGDFYVEPWEKPTMMHHLLELSGVAAPRICLLATATGDNPSDIELFYRSFGQMNCRPTHLSLMAPVTMDFADYFCRMDIIYVGGGATKNLMAIWKAWGIDTALRQAWDNGVVLSGTSAGSICWFESCITDSYPPAMLPLRCTGFLKGSACTHYDKRPDRPVTFRKLIANGTIDSPGIATDNDVAIHYINDGLHEVVTARDGAAAYLVSRTADGFVETRIPPRLIS